jgi:hypothetical protein
MLRQTTTIVKEEPSKASISLSPTNKQESSHTQEKKRENSQI